MRRRYLVTYSRKDKVQERRFRSVTSAVVAAYKTARRVRGKSAVHVWRDKRILAIIYGR